MRCLDVQSVFVSFYLICRPLQQRSILAIGSLTRYNNAYIDFCPLYPSFSYAQKDLIARSVILRMNSHYAMNLTNR